MSLRRKLLMVLLLTAVLPMLAVRAVQAVSIFKLQTKVADDMRERLTDEAEQDMLRTVDSHALTLEQRGSHIAALLQAQASEVERRLAGSAPDTPPRVPTTQQFNAWAEADPVAAELVDSPRHFIVDADGALLPQSVSYKSQILVPVRNARPRQRDRTDRDRERADADLARLADLTTVYRSVYEQADDIILWQYTALDSGLHLSYPGKAGMPMEIRCRKDGSASRQCARVSAKATSASMATAPETSPR